MRFWKNTAIHALLASVVVCQGASAADAGNYDCQVRKAFGVTAGSGARIKMPPVMNSFTLELGDGPIFGDQLKASPRRQTEVYDPEARAAAVARIHADLFDRPAERMVSYDRQSFSEGNISLILRDNGDFVAYGPFKSADKVGAAVYAGSCKPASRN